MVFAGELIKSRSALRTVFDHIFLQIEKLVAEQIAEVSEKNLRVKVRYMLFAELLALTRVQAILLVGGLGRNKYLYDRLMVCHASDGVQVMQVNGAFVSPISTPLIHAYGAHRWSSICRGATLWGLEHSSFTMPSPISSRISRYSYGMTSSPIYDPTKHLEEDKYLDVEGKYRARRQMTWLLRRVRPLSLSPCSFEPSQLYRAKTSTKVAC